MEIRDAHPDEARQLWQLAIRSKAEWGYDAAFMAACSQELYPTDLSMAAVVVEGQRLVGFHTLEREADGNLELGHLFVDRECWGRGIGRALVNDARRRAAAAGYRAIIIQGDPHAASFYERCGAVHVGYRPSGSIVGRQLPVFLLKVNEV